MNRIFYPTHRILPYLIVVAAFALYVVAFAYFHDLLGIEVASLAIVPVIGASWYFGVRGGLMMAGLSIIVDTLILLADDHVHDILENRLGNWIGALSLLIIALVLGKLSATSRERRDALNRLAQVETDRERQMAFLERLNEITALALDADSLQATLEILTEQIASLFKADDVYLSLWEPALGVPIPAVAYGSLADVFPYMQFRPGDLTATTSVLKAGRPLTIENIDDSPYINPGLAALFPNKSLLAIPLTTHRHKLGALLVGYNKRRTFSEKDIFQAGVLAEQAGLILSKSQLLEEERKQVRQLTALHDVAVTSIEADNEDELIERVTEIIGKNLYPDNFGILLLDGEGEFLSPHPSYRFYTTENLEVKSLPLGKGITGQVALAGQPQRIGNVRTNEHYIDMDNRTLSELCVPIKFKEQVLGVINAESTKRDAFSAEDERLLVTLAGQLATAIEQNRRAQAERKWLDQLAHSNDLIYSIAQITTQVERSLSTSEIIQTLGQELEKIGLTCIMAVYNAERETFTVNYTSLEPHLLAIVETGLGYPLLDYTFPRHKIASLSDRKDLLHPAVLQHPEQEIEALFTELNLAGIRALLRMIGITREIEPLRLPLVFEGNLLGILWVWGKSIIRSDVPMMSIFARQIGISLERARLFQEVQSLALIDPLTCLQNRRSVFELGRIEFARAQRMNRPFSCMMIDIDHFKSINDNYGHQVGDQALQEFARRCLHSVREVDLVGRYGGEEFIILLPETDRDTSVQVAERLRMLIQETPFEIQEAIIPVTVSIGVATKDENTTHLEALVARADQALYIAKHKGRNRVAISV